MAKITLDNITSQFGSNTLFNTNFQAIEDTLNNDVLYRNNPGTEPNQMLNDLDMNSNDILNADLVETNLLKLGGTFVGSSENFETQTYLDTEFTNVMGQTVFAVDYTVSFVDVYVNGSLQADADYTAIDGTTVTLAQPVVSNSDVITIRSFSAFSCGDGITQAAADARYLQTSNDLTDLNNVATARTNLDVYSKAETTALLPNRNLVINGNFGVNQRAVTGTVVLAAGEYGHDRFKAGSGGCTYTFNTNAGVTTLTITAGTLQQVIEGTLLPAKDVVLSWTGTAQGRIDSGAYGDSGLVTDTTTGGADITVEFDIGTLANVQLEVGDTSTEFESIDPANELNKCQRYFERKSGSTNSVLATGYCSTTGEVQALLDYKTTKRIVPTITSSTTSAVNVLSQPLSVAATNSITFSQPNADSTRLTTTTTAPVLAAGEGCLIAFSGTTEYIDIDAEL